ncbi:unnamed protein product [Sympodiomycopsis kandeliae]
MPKHAMGGQVTGHQKHLGELLFPTKNVPQGAKEILSFHDVQTLFLLQGWLPSPDTLRYLLEREPSKAQRVEMKKLLLHHIVNSRLFDDHQRLPKIKFMAVEATAGQKEVSFLDIELPEEVGPARRDALRQASREWNMLPGVKLPECLSFSNEEILKALKPTDIVIKVRRVPGRLLKDQNFRNQFPAVLGTQLTIAAQQDDVKLTPAVLSMYAICTVQPGKQQYTDEVLVHVQTPQGTVAREVAGSWISGAHVKFDHSGFTFPLVYAGQNIATDAGFNGGNVAKHTTRGHLYVNGRGNGVAAGQAAKHGLQSGETNGMERISPPLKGQPPLQFANVAQPIPPPEVKIIEHCPQCGYHRVTAPNGSFKPQNLKFSQQASRKHERAVAALQVLPPPQINGHQSTDIEMATDGPLDDGITTEMQIADLTLAAQLASEVVNGVDLVQDSVSGSVPETRECKKVEEIDDAVVSTTIEPSSSIVSSSSSSAAAAVPVSNGEYAPHDESGPQMQRNKDANLGIRSVLYLDVMTFNELVSHANSSQQDCVSPTSQATQSIADLSAGRSDEIGLSEVVNEDKPVDVEKMTTGAQLLSLGANGREANDDLEPSVIGSTSVKPFNTASNGAEISTQILGFLPHSKAPEVPPAEEEYCSLQELHRLEDEELLMRLNRESPPGSPPPVTSRGPVQSLDAYIEEDDAREVMHKQYEYREPRDRSTSNNSVVHWPRQLELDEALDWLDREERLATGAPRPPEDARSLGSDIDEAELRTLVVDGNAPMPAHETGIVGQASPSGTSSILPGRSRPRRGRGLGFPLCTTLPTRAESNSNATSQDAEYTAWRERILFDPMDRPLSPDLTPSDVERQQRAAAASFLSARLEAQMREQAEASKEKDQSHNKYDPTDTGLDLGDGDVQPAREGGLEDKNVALLFPNMDFSDEDDTKEEARPQQDTRSHDAKPYILDGAPPSSSSTSYRGRMDTTLSSEGTLDDSFWTKASSQLTSESNEHREESKSTATPFHGLDFPGEQNQGGSSECVPEGSRTSEKLSQGGKETEAGAGQTDFASSLDYQLALSLALSQNEDEAFLGQVSDGFEEYFDTQSSPLDYDLFE